MTDTTRTRTATAPGHTGDPAAADGGAPRTLSTWRALNSALHEAMKADDSVFVMGEDLTRWGTGGGIYGVTRKLAETFGQERVRDTPISEEVIVSAAVAAAMRGTRPVVEIMYSDFSLLAMDGIVNQAAKARYMFGGQFEVPLVLRTNQGSGIGKAAQHSQSLEALFAHIPGLEVVVPGSAGDAYGLLLSAIASPNPTIFLEHKALYNDRGPVATGPIPLGLADVVRPGTDVTVVATQLMRKRALEAADALTADGISVEVVDPRTLYPLDIDTIIASAAHTGRVVVAHEAPELYGFGAELAAQLSRRLWGNLRAAPRRLGGARTPIPYAKGLETSVVPDTRLLVNEIKDLMSLS
ncbi:alpha-ketoacid dehydrogenase subunit beta [Streptomyces sp. NPDC005373]|uniref:alpha-ketoacid dehydrogenase subunit beta n=1 Tax=Streptomyces sp. NPDC005373 TaxID=3156879 RepID=UPI0033ACD2B2